MQSWFYNDFATEADRTAAFQDISDAEVDLTSAGAEVARSAAQVSIDQKRVNQAFDELTQRSSEITTRQFEELEEVRINAARQFLAMQANLDNLQSQQQITSMRSLDLFLVPSFKRLSTSAHKDGVTPGKICPSARGIFCPNPTIHAI